MARMLTSCVRFLRLYQGGSLTDRRLLTSHKHNRRHVSEIVYRPMTEEDKPVVRQFLYDQFFLRNPVCQILDMDPKIDCKLMVDQHFSIITPSLSVVAMDSSGDVAGVSLQSRLSLAEQVNQKSPMPLQTTSEKEKTLDIFNREFVENSVVSRVNIFQKYDVDVFLRMRYGTAHFKHAGKGVLKNIVLNVANIGKQHGISCVIAAATNRVSMRVLDKLGFECLMEAPIFEWKCKGNAVFAGVNESVFLMGKQF